MYTETFVYFHFKILPSGSSFLPSSQMYDLSMTEVADHLIKESPTSKMLYTSELQPKQGLQGTSVLLPPSVPLHLTHSSLSLVLGSLFRRYSSSHYIYICETDILTPILTARPPRLLPRRLPPTRRNRGRRTDPT